VRAVLVPLVMALAGMAICWGVLSAARESSPFDLGGPPFLAFYAAMCLATISILPIARGLLENGEPPRLPLHDPLVLAYLRGGPAETLRTATLGLFDRNLLGESDGALAATTQAKDFVGTDVERACLSFFTPFDKSSNLLRDADCLARCEAYREVLEPLGLVPGASQRRVRHILLALVLLGLGGVTFEKVSIALERGHRNIGFLLIETAVAMVLAVKVHNHVRTASGDALLRDMRELFAPLRARAPALRAGMNPAELVWLVAVFGPDGSPVGAGYFQRLFPRPQPKQGSCSSTGGCGGGGCGGGCGGCGA
jgi:uncharacterized protein (TIGR04222 family)